MPGQHFSYIDALRGWAILGVIVTHASSYCQLGTQLAVGARGVQLFFVVSAFTLMHSWHSKQDGARNFYTRRFFRIAPMWWLAMLLFWPQLSAKAPIHDVLLNALFLHGLSASAIEASVGGGWSVGVEMMFYAVFPFLAAAIRGVPSALVTLLLAYYASDWWLSKRHLYAPDPFAFLALPAQLTAFAAGIAAYWVWRRLDKFPMLGFGLILAGIVLAGWYTIVNVHHLPAFGVSFGLITLGCALGGGSWLTPTFMQRLGVVSYSGYLLHWFAINGVNWVVAPNSPIDFPIFLALVIASTYVISSITYRYVEAPSIAFGNMWARGQSGQRQPK